MAAVLFPGDLSCWRLTFSICYFPLLQRNSKEKCHQGSLIPAWIPSSIAVPLLFLAQLPALSSVFWMQRAGDKPQCCAGGGVLPFLAKSLSCSPAILMWRCLGPLCHPLPAFWWDFASSPELQAEWRGKSAPVPHLLLEVFLCLILWAPSI